MILDDFAAQEQVLEFCRSCGRETYHGKNCWDTVLSKSSYFRYKRDHPKFTKKVEKACHFFFVVALKENPHRIENVWQKIDDKVQNGVTETRVFAEFKYKTDEEGKIILDPVNHKPIIDELIGTAKHYVIQKPCPACTLQWLADKYEKVSHQI